MIRQQVPHAGRKTAALAIIGESADAQSVAARTPFTGYSGQVLGKWLRAAGLTRGDAYLDNVVQRKPPSNRLDRLPPGELEEWQDDFVTRLAKLKPRVLVPTGRTALQAVMGSRASITKQRGSVYWVQLPGGHECKVLPILHPSAVFRNPKYGKWCEHDWMRVAEELKTVEITSRPDREHFIHPTLNDVKWWVREVEKGGADAVLSVDLEVLRRVKWEDKGVSKRTGKPLKPRKVYTDPRIVCAGMALGDDFGFVVPTTEEFWGSKARVREVWALLRRACESKAQKVLQNGMFDWWWLEWEQGVSLLNYLWDCKAMHHAIDAADDHDLAYLTSYYTNEPYYKDESKDPEETQKWVGSGSEQLWQYCSKDATVEWEVASKLHTELARSNRVDWYLKHYTALQPALVEMSLTGVPMDDKWRAAKSAELQRSIDMRRQALTRWTGVDLYGKKTLSNDKLKKLLYGSKRNGGMGLPKKRDRRTGNLTVKEVVVRQLMGKHTELDVVGPAILDQRREAQLLQFVAEARVNPDTGRMHSSYGFTPETGRLSSTKAPDRSGCNYQNQDREVRPQYVSQPGEVLLEVDYSQAEARIVQVLTGDPRMLEFAHSKPWEFDVHTFNAAIIFKCAEDTVTKLQRYLGKRGVHGSSYDMHGKTLAEGLLKEGFVFTDDECTAMIESYHEFVPSIREVWHRDVRQKVIQDRRMTNVFGRSLDFTYTRMGDDTWRRAYAFEPQSTIADMLNQRGLVPCFNHVREQWKARTATLLAHIHDALLWSVKPELVWDLAKLMQDNMEEPLEIAGESLVIPCEFKVGLRWGGSQDIVEWKRLPEKDEMVSAAIEMVKKGTEDGLWEQDL